MRDELNMMELADRYLRGELNATDRAAFEERMRTSAELREAVDDLSALHSGMQRLTLRPSVDKAYRSYKLGKWLPWVGGAVIIGSLLTSAYIATEGSEIQDPVDQEQTAPEPPVEPSGESPDSLTEPAGEGSTGPIENRSHSQQTDTVVMIMRDGHLVPMTARDTIGKRVYTKVITVPVEGSSPEALKARIDSIKNSGTTYSRPGLEKISVDSLQKLFGGDKAPFME